MTERELLLYFALIWIGAVAVWILLDFLGNNWPKRRFRARGYRIPFNLRNRGQVVRSLRRLRDEQVRDTLESATGKPTLALSRKRRHRVASRRRPSWTKSPPAAEVDAVPERPQISPPTDEPAAPPGASENHSTDD